MDDVGICNLGLGWLGANLITSLEDESTEAELCKANFDILRLAVLEGADWAFARFRAVLTPEATEDPFERDTLYLVPTDAVIIRSVYRDYTERFPVEWDREGDHLFVWGELERIYTTYTKDITDTSKFTPLATHALAGRLAADLAMPLTENPDLQKDMWEIYTAKLAEAETSDGLQGRSQRIRSDHRYTFRRYR